MDNQLSQFEDIFARFGDMIFRHILYRLGDRERAKELTQEVFMRTWQHLSLGKPIEHEKAFLYRIANNLFINEIRTDKTSTSLEVLKEESGYEVIAPERGPSDFSLEQELLEFLNDLSPRYREVLVYRYVDDMAVKDIANLLGEKETAISMRITRATEKLKQRYQL